MINECWNVLYGRQSLDKKDSISIEMQFEKGRGLFPEENNFIEYADKGFSGKNINRPAFTSMMEKVKEGCVKRIIVYRIDRFSRSLLDFIGMWEILNRYHVEFVSVNERFDTGTPMGKAMLFILMVFAQLERETIAERVTDNYYARSGLGQWPGGPAPVGFEIVRVTHMSKSFASLMASETMSYIVDAYEQYANNPTVTLSSVGKYLYKKVPGEWSNTSLARVFRNPAYVKADEALYYFFEQRGIKIVNDKQEFDGTRGAILIGKEGNTYDNRGQEPESIDKMQLSLGTWEGAVDSHIWIACQQKMLKNVKKRNNGKGKHTWLTGLLKCGFCGKAMVMYVWEKKHGKYRYITCSKKNKTCPHFGSFPTIDEMEDEVALRIMTLFRDCKNKEYKNDSKINKLKNSITSIDLKIENFLNVIGNGAADLTVQYINKELQKLSKMKQQLVDEMFELERNIGLVTIPKIIFTELDYDEKKLIAASVINRIQIFEDVIEIEWKI